MVEPHDEHSIFYFDRAFPGNSLLHYGLFKSGNYLLQHPNSDHSDAVGERSDDPPVEEIRKDRDSLSQLAGHVLG